MERNINYFHKNNYKFKIIHFSTNRDNNCHFTSPSPFMIMVRRR